MTADIVSHLDALAHLAQQRANQRPETDIHVMEPTA